MHYITKALQRVIHEQGGAALSDHVLAADVAVAVEGVGRVLEHPGEGALGGDDGGGEVLSGHEVTLASVGVA